MRSYKSDWYSCSQQDSQTLIKPIHSSLTVLFDNIHTHVRYTGFDSHGDNKESAPSVLGYLEKLFMLQSQYSVPCTEHSFKTVSTASLLGDILVYTHTPTYLPLQPSKYMYMYVYKAGSQLPRAQTPFRRKCSTKTAANKTKRARRRARGGEKLKGQRRKTSM